jgi:transposase
MKMKKIYEISNDEAKIIREKMKSVRKASVYRRLETIALLGEGKTPKQISEITKQHEKYVRTLGGNYNKKGLEVFVCDSRKGGNHRLMSDEESTEFLKQFEDVARSGQIITVEEIAEAFDKATNKQRASLSTVYNFLHRNGWRKVMPRSKHPNKASDEAIEASKKLTLELKN